MMGSLFAVVCAATAVATFFLEDSLVMPALFLVGIGAFFAVLRRARPVLLLGMFVAIVLAFVVQPEALSSIVAGYGIDLDLSNLFHAMGVATMSLAMIAFLFMIACRRQSGGYRFGTLETSEDLARLIHLVGNSAALLFIPMLALPVYLVATQSGLTDLVSIEHVSWSSQPTTASEPHVQIFAWLLAVIMLGALPAAYMQNCHHRVTPLRARLSDRARAWLELLGGLAVLLPLCVIAVDLGLVLCA